MTKDTKERGAIDFILFLNPTPSRGKNMNELMNGLQLMSAMQLLLTFGNLCIMLYAFSKFLMKPHTSLDARVSNLEFKVKEINESLNHGSDKFREQDSANEVLLHSVIALIEFEIQYCLTEKKAISPELQKAKEDLHDYLAKK